MLIVNFFPDAPSQIHSVMVSFGYFMSSDRAFYLIKGEQGAR